MKVFQQLSRRFASRYSQQDTQLHEWIHEGRRAKYAEEYERALDILEQARQLALTLHDPTASAIITLHRVDVLMMSQRHEEARAILEGLQTSAEQSAQRTQLAYILCSMGTLAQTQGNWAEARKYYEQALEIAQTAYAVGAEGRAKGHLADTYLYEKNASYAVHLLQEALPRLESSGDIEIGSYFVGRLGQAMIESGHREEGEQILERALLLAEKMQYKLYIRMWRLALAQVHLDQKRYHQALSDYHQAFALFMPAQPPTEEYARALCGLSRTQLALRQVGAAVEESARAVSVSEKLNNEILQITAQALHGLALQASGSHEAALKQLEAASGMLNRLDGVDSLRVEVLCAMAQSQSESGSPQTAVQTYQRAVEAASQEEDSYPKALCGLAVLLREQGDLASAIQEWTKALNWYESHHQALQTARLYCDVADARLMLGQGARAFKDYEQALMLLGSVDDAETRGIVLANAAIGYFNRGDVESAENFFNESITIARTLGDRAAESNRMGNYGWHLLMTDRVQQGVRAIETAHKLSQELGLRLQAAIQTDNMGLGWRLLNETARALELHQSALEQAQALATPRWEAAFQINQGFTLLAAGRHDEAAPLFQKTLQASRDLKDNDLIVQSLIGEAHAALHIGPADRLAESIDEAVMLARRSEMRRWLAEALILQSQYQAKIGDLEKAHLSWEESEKLFRLFRLSLPTPHWLNSTA